MSSRCSLGSMPLELLELTASYIHSLHDIVSLALTCRKCKEATIPRYTEYIVISCHYRRSEVWRHLEARPDLAKNVRKLTVVCDGPPAIKPPERFPSTLLKGREQDGQSLSPGECLKLVARAICRMTTVVTCSWTVDLLFEVPVEQEAEEDMWSALSKSISIEHLYFSEPWNYRILYTHDTYTVPTHPIWSIANLKSLSLLNAPFLWNQQAATHFATMLSNSPNLETLSIKLNNRECIMSPIFNRCRWPKLRTLSLLIYSDGRLHSEAFSAFLDAHPAIENLEWEYLPPDKLSAGSLPRLRNLRGRDDTSAIVKILVDKPHSSPRKIESLGLIPLNEQFLRTLQSIDAQKLRKLELRFFESLVFIRKLADMFTSLTWLQVPSVNYMQSYKAATHHRVQMDEWINILRFFRNLEVFHGVSFFNDPAEASNENDQMARRLVKTNPKLRRVDHWDAMSNKVVILIKEHAQGSMDGSPEANGDLGPVPGAIRWKEVVPVHAGGF